MLRHHVIPLTYLSPNLYILQFIIMLYHVRHDMVHTVVQIFIALSPENRLNARLEGYTLLFVASQVTCKYHANFVVIIPYHYRIITDD